MNYQETTEYLFNIAPVFEKVGASAYKEGLHNSHALDVYFGCPHKHYATIHVAGTNGKGSCSHSLASILQAQGYKVGLYTSPHLVDFRERIRVNGVCISEAHVVDFVAKHRHFFEPLQPSFFELTTAMALHYFKEQAVDVAVIEVGLGGRLDCTNIITPKLSVITNISLDHTQFLGNSLAQIATEKAGIIKPRVPVIIGETTPETRPVFTTVAQKAGAPIVFAQDNNEILHSHYDVKAQVREYETLSFGLLEGDLAGDYQDKNTNTVLHAVAALRAQGIALSDASVQMGLKNVIASTHLWGRWQQVGEQPTVICDTGHNMGGWQYLSVQLQYQLDKLSAKALSMGEGTAVVPAMRIVFGMVDDKDLDSIVKLLPKEAVYYFTQPSTHRAFPAEKVALAAASSQLQGSVYHSVADAFQAAMHDAHAQDFVFVGGSSYVVADFLSTFVGRRTERK